MPFRLPPPLEFSLESPFETFLLLAKVVSWIGKFPKVFFTDVDEEIAEDADKSWG